MATKRSLYEILGVHETAGVDDIHRAYQDKLAELESARGRFSPDQFNDRLQVLRLAFSTLSDATTRFGYDAKLAASRQPGALRDNRALAVTARPTSGGTLTEAHAEALALRADALALRADAMMLRAGLEPQLAHRAEPSVMRFFKLFTRAVGLLVIVAVAAFSLTRCVASRTQTEQHRLESKASEQAALQEYQRTHGVRPANIAEMELLEAERRKAENQQRTAKWEQDKQEQDQRRFIEEARRRGEQVAENLRRAEERAQLQAERDEERRKAEENAKQAAEQRRLDRERERWQSILRR